MAEASRVRPVEYYNPRPMILGLCFVWGIVVGFGINFFRSPQTTAQPASGQTQQVTETVRPVPSEIERRRQDIPNLAEVDPAPIASPSLKQTLEDFQVEPPQAVLTTEGGLTGRTAQSIRQPGAVTRPSMPSSSPSAPVSTPSATPPPPPIPDLAPW